MSEEEIVEICRGIQREMFEIRCGPSARHSYAVRGGDEHPCPDPPTSRASADQPEGRWRSAHHADGVLHLISKGRADYYAPCGVAMVSFAFQIRDAAFAFSAPTRSLQQS